MSTFREILRRAHDDSPVFEISPNKIGVFCPYAAAELYRRNNLDLTLPDKISDIVHRRTGPSVSWSDVRSLFIEKLRALMELRIAREMPDLMNRVILQSKGDAVDLGLLGHRVMSRPVVDLIVDGLSPSERVRVDADQDFKIKNVCSNVPLVRSRTQIIRESIIQIRAGTVVRRHIRRRSRSRSAQSNDLLSALLPILDNLGIDRAVQALTGVLTAIAGPPGAVAACLIYELLTRPKWRERIRGELSAIDPANLAASGPRIAPISYDFVRETLRMWAPPLLLSKSIKENMIIDDVNLVAGGTALFSPFIIHHDARHWDDPDTFRPERWQQPSNQKPGQAATFVPFGWPPRLCVGATLGIRQLLLVCRLFAVEHELSLKPGHAPPRPRVAVAMPHNFYGTIVS